MNRCTHDDREEMRWGKGTREEAWRAGDEGSNESKKSTWIHR